MRDVYPEFPIASEQSAIFDGMLNVKRFEGFSNSWCQRLLLIVPAAGAG